MNDFLQSLRINKERRYSKGRRTYDENRGNTGGNHNTGYDNSGNRHGNERRSPKPSYQKDYNQRDYGHRDRRDYNSQGNDYRPPRQQHSPLTGQAVETLISTIGGILENQKDQLYIQEQRAIAEDRKIAALENIAACLQILVSEAAEAEKSSATAQEESFEIKAEDTFNKEEPAVRDPEPVKTSAKDPIHKKTTPKNDIGKSASKKQGGKITPQMRVDIMKIIEKMRSEGATFDEVAKHLASLNLPTFSGRGDWHAQTVHRLCNKK